MKKILVLSGLVGGLLCVYASSYADPVLHCRFEERPGITGRAQDMGRSVTGVITSIINLCGEGESKAQLIATQEQNNKNTSGKGGSAGSTDTSQGKLSSDGTSLGSAGESEFSGSAFDYINTTLLSSGIGNVGYEPIKEALSSDRQSIRSAVLKNFFVDPTNPEQATTEHKNKVKAERNAYIQEASSRHVMLGYRVKGHIQNDLTVISSVPVTGDGELGAIAVDSHTLEQMVKMELVDLALQIEMMEADAIQFLLQQPVELMRETKASSS